MLDLFKVIHSLSFVVSSLIQCQLLQGTKTKKLNNKNEFVGQISQRATSPQWFLLLWALVGPLPATIRENEAWNSFILWNKFTLKDLSFR